LFLDEVADLPLHMQVKAVRVIQEKTVRPVASIARRRSTCVFSPPLTSISPISWRSRNSAKNLFYRINVIELRVPPLRERAEDIPTLADAIVRRLARR
jgi:two-component system response regulator PilR (NtrC family)